MFYEESGGGVTLSGGEVMAQDMDYIEQLLKKLKRKGYNVAIDTCGYAPQENYERVLPYVDTFLYDIKTMDPEKHEKYMGKDNELILSNLRFISERGARIYIRIPVIGGVNDTEEEMEAMITFLKQSISVSQINLLPYHNIAGGKYDKLDIRYKGEAFTIPPKEQMEAFQRQFIQNGFAIQKSEVNYEKRYERKNSETERTECQCSSTHLYGACRSGDRCVHKVRRLCQCTGDEGTGI